MPFLHKAGANQSCLPGQVPTAMGGSERRHGHRLPRHLAHRTATPHGAVRHCERSRRAVQHTPGRRGDRHSAEQGGPLRSQGQSETGRKRETWGERHPRQGHSRSKSAEAGTAEKCRGQSGGSQGGWQARRWGWEDTAGLAHPVKLQSTQFRF